MSFSETPFRSDVYLRYFILFLTKPAAASLGIHISDRRGNLTSVLTEGSQITATDLRGRTSPAF